MNLKSLNLNVVIGFAGAIVVAVLAGPALGLIGGKDKDFLLLIVGALVGLGTGVAARGKPEP